MTERERPAGELKQQDDDGPKVGETVGSADPAGSGRDDPANAINAAIYGMREQLQHVDTLHDSISRCHDNLCVSPTARLSQPEVTDEKKRPSYPGNPYHQALRECFDTEKQARIKCCTIEDVVDRLKKLLRNRLAAGERAAYRTQGGDDE
jgi:hypothetical protein